MVVQGFGSGEDYRDGCSENLVKLDLPLTGPMPGGCKRDPTLVRAVNQ